MRHALFPLRTLAGWSMVALMVAAVIAMANSPAHAQVGRNLGFQGGSSLPSQQLGSDFFTGVTGSSRFTARGSGTPYGPLAARLNAGPEGSLRPGQFTRQLQALDKVAEKLSTLGSYMLGRRARFSELQQVSLDLASMLNEEDLVRPDLVGESFLQLVFPFGFRDKAEAFGYGYFCPGCLGEGRMPAASEYLAEFTREVQTDIAQQVFLDAVAAMVRQGDLPDDARLDEFSDSQLAAMGNYLFSNARYGPAARVWRLLAERRPTSSLYAMAAGQSLLAAGRPAEATPLLRRSLTEAPGWGAADFRIGGVNLQDIYPDPADLAEARRKLEATLADRPNDPELRFAMAYVNLFHGVWQRARGRLGELAGEGDAVAAELARVFDDGRVAQSIRRPLGKAARITPGDLAVFHGGGSTLTPQQQSELVNSILDPKSASDYLSRGDYYFFMGNYTQAEQAYRAALTLEPDNAIARFALGHAAFAAGEFAYAAKNLRQALEARPDWGVFNFRLAEFFGDPKDLHREMDDLEHLVEMRPDDESLRFLLGYMYFFTGRYGESAEMLARAMAAAPEYNVARKLLELARLQS